MPRMWKARSVAIAAWSSLPGRPVGARIMRKEKCEVSDIDKGDNLEGKLEREAIRTDVEVGEYNVADAVDGLGGMVGVMVTDRGLEGRLVAG